MVACKTLYGDEWFYKAEEHPDAEEIEKRIEEYYSPYHDALENQVERKLNQHGYCLVFDVHSCPSKGTPADSDTGQERPDIIISDADGLSCDLQLVNKLRETAQSSGFTAGVNHVYKGGYITELYSKHASALETKNCESIQIEFSRAILGMNEETLEIEDTGKLTNAQELTAELLNIMAQYATENSQEPLLR